MDEFFKNSFVINRNCDTYRFNITNNILKSNNIKCKRFEAITPIKTINSYTTNEIEGCGMSHKALWKYIVDNKISHAVIFEDDITFVDNWKESFVQSLKTLPYNWDILTLGNFGIKNINDKYTSPFNYILFLIVTVLDIYNKKACIYNKNLSIPYFYTGAYSYAVSYKGAKKLLKYIKNINYHIDVLVSYHSNKLNIFSLNNDICYQRSEISTINNKKNDYLKLHLELFKHIKDDKNINYDYYMNVPVYKIEFINKYLLINGWLILVVICAMFIKYTRNILLILFTYNNFLYQNNVKYKLNFNLNV